MAIDNTRILSVVVRELLGRERGHGAFHNGPGRGAICAALKLGMGVFVGSFLYLRSDFCQSLQGLHRVLVEKSADALRIRRELLCRVFMSLRKMPERTS